MKIHPLAGKAAPGFLLANIPKLITAYYANTPNSLDPLQKVSFGTSGHRGSPLQNRFNEQHILAITQAICLYREQQKITGPLFLGIDTHALSEPAKASALEVLAANNVTVLLDSKGDYTPTPVISHAILHYNKGRKEHLADGIVITPSHNPPAEGGFKYNPPNGGPADQEITRFIETQANSFLQNQLKGVKRCSLEKALSAATTQKFDFASQYIDDLINVVDLELIRHSQIRLAVDPMGGAGVHYWQQIAERYGLHLHILNKTVDPTFRFTTVDWDGQIRMDPSSSYAMQSLISVKDQFDLCFAADTDHDRHGIVTPSCGLLAANHYLSAAIYYLIEHRPLWSKNSGIGKTLVSTQLIDRIASNFRRPLYEVPVGFKWFVEGLLSKELFFGGEESAGASFSRLDGSVWTTDKDGITAALLAAEMTVKKGKDPGLLYQEITQKLGFPYSGRIEAVANLQQKAQLQKISASTLSIKELAGEAVQSILTKAPGNQAPIGGVKITTENGWFAARPSGTEEIYKIYAESFKSQQHLEQIQQQAQSIVDAAIA